ncbi:amid-like mitochondrial oxidoreductase [Phlyctema vagabunda]|uniref:Amid-like mitochondrial oxidoreductase n=1 Tax=Phlyctema vagabunda TaxID=108571 RepID=A0ABR4PSZ8_9HELO
MAKNNNSADAKPIVILGGSYGGVSAAHYIQKHVIPQLPEKSTYQVKLVSASSYTMCRPACPRALISDDMFPQDKLFVSISKSFEKYPTATFQFIHGTATEVQHSKRTVSLSLATGDTEIIGFYALVIATGASTPSPLLGLNSDEKFLRSSWGVLREKLSTAKTIVIAGGGPAGVETAGELGEFLNGRSKQLPSISPPKVDITIVSAGAEILTALRPAIAEKARQHLAKVGVNVINNTRVTNIEPQTAGTESVASKATLTLDNGSTLEADIYIPATGSKPNTAFLSSELLTPDGRVHTNKSTLRVDKAGERIYAIGDASSYARPAIHVILSAVPVLCANMKNDLLSAYDGGSAKEDRIFKEDTRETQMVPIGKSKGVGAAMGYQLPSFLVWLIKGRDYWMWTTGKLWSGQQWAKAS